MALRPLPNLEDEKAMAKLGRLSALRSARLDAVHDLRDAVTQLNSAACNEDDAIKAARAAIDRLEALQKLGDAA